MRVLIGCEESGTVREAFKARGHNAWSCDLEKTRIPGQHLRGDVTSAILWVQWDLIILHPPCTALAVSGNRWYGKGMPRHEERIKAIRWTYELFLRARNVCDKVCLENPVGVMNSLMPRPQYIQPWQFGHGETKKTGLWLYGLPKLTPTNIVEGRDDRIHKMPPGPNRARDRSKTYQGIADAMAEQWG